ncbi:hypothetical protein Agub_g12157 [Astrephomene gubernaculifera]|uniref:Uncharacterized protein n=1 Tax=Astrephomene gubernaculifera TaxID=47775 RepID=A0AAD3DY35_9CHLO|nr:hypothetical protein Agub_g12157 [Astrephomene gubernaculifera]
MSTVFNRCRHGAARLCSGSCYQLPCPSVCIHGDSHKQARLYNAPYAGNAMRASHTSSCRPCANIDDVYTLQCYGGGSGRGFSGSGNNGNGGSSSGQGGSFDGNGNHLASANLKQALLAAIVVSAAASMFPAQSHAMPGSTSGSPLASFLGGSPKGSKLSSSAPAHSGGLGASLGRNSMDIGSHGSSSSTSTSSSPLRPRSKVMHVACKGSTLVVPLTAGEAKEDGSKLPHMSLWQRRRVVEAPIELSEREVSMLAGSRQNRVRDSLLV